MEEGERFAVVVDVFPLPSRGVAVVAVEVVAVVEFPILSRGFLFQSCGHAGAEEG